MRFKWLRFKTISWKLTILYAFVFSMVLILLNAGTLYGVKFFLAQESINQVKSSAAIVENKIMEAIEERTSINDSEILNEIQSNSDIHIRIADSQGNIINSSDHFGTTSLKILSHLNRVRKVESHESHLMVLNRSIMVKGKTKAYFQVVRDMNKDYAFIKLLFMMMAAADALGIIGAIITGFIISRRVLKPIDKITQTAKSISIGDLDKPMEVGETDDELTRLVVTFNDMIERLRISFEKQNQFVADASHELRTPISVIDGYINLMDRWGKEDKEVLQESVEAIKSETRNMNELVEKLLFLARVDTGQFKLTKESVDISQLIEEVIKESRLIAPHHKFIAHTDERIQIFADRKMIKQMLRALMDNSIKFTPAEGEISITAEAASKELKIVVKDTGAGIPQDELDRIFNRFYRVDKARAKETGGTGLGLSIVKWIVDVHKGKIFVKSKLGKGTSIIIMLPF